MSAILLPRNFNGDAVSIRHITKNVDSKACFFTQATVVFPALLDSAKIVIFFKRNNLLHKI